MLSILSPEATPSTTVSRSSHEFADRWTAEDDRALQQCENQIAHGERSFWHTGSALRRIQENRLYRKSHETFDHYVEDRWEMSPAHAYRLIEAAKLMKRLAESLQFGERDVLPANESHLRQLARLPAKYQVRAWREVVQQSRDQGVRITARLIGQKVDETLKIARRRPKPVRAPKPAPAAVQWERPGRKLAAFMCELGVPREGLAQQIHDALLIWHRQQGVDRTEAVAILSEVAERLLAA